MGQPITKDHAEYIYNTYQLDLYKLALLMTRSKTMAEDIVSETFLKTFEHFAQYDDSKPLKPWLNKILINNVRQTARKQKRWFLMETIPDAEDTHNFVEHFFSKEQDLALWEMVNQLTMKSREVVVLHYYEQLSLPEVATLLQIPLGTCKSRLNTALTQLRRIVPSQYLESC